MSATIERSAVSVDGDRPPEGDRFVATAAVLLALVLLGFQAIIRELIPPLAIFGVVFLGVGAALAVRRRRWLLVVAVILVVVYIGGSIPFFAANLAHPESPVSFLAEAFILITGLVVAAGAVLGLLGAGRRARGVVAVAGGALALGAVIVSAVAVAGLDSDAPSPGDVRIEIVGAAFPERVEAPSGPATLWVDNQDPVHHTLVIEGADVRVVMPASTAVRAEVALAPGVYRFYCDVPGHERMEGEIVAD